MSTPTLSLDVAGLLAAGVAVAGAAVGWRSRRAARRVTDAAAFVDGWARLVEGLQGDAGRLRVEVAELRAQVDALAAELDQARGRVAELERELIRRAVIPQATPARPTRPRRTP